MGSGRKAARCRRFEDTKSCKLEKILVEDLDTIKLKKSYVQKLSDIEHSCRWWEDD